ncbi:recombinase family protein [Priestia megaterium]|uniref:recombinase family protein n=1 Tax=Priestia megaterium TaxID=1404 RepID=UPI00363E965E
MKYGYVRVSTIEQDYTMQVEKIKEYGVLEADIYSDKATGKNLEREGLETVLDLLKEGDTLVVWKLDRLGRSVSKILGLLEELTEKGINVIAIKDNIDTTDGDSIVTKIMTTMFSLFADIERTLILERTSDGRERAKERGVKFGRKEIQQYNDKKARLENAIEEYKKGEKTAKECITLSGVSRPTFYKKLRQYGVIA